MHQDVGAGLLGSKVKGPIIQFLSTIVGGGESRYTTTIEETTSHISKFVSEN